MEPMNAPINNGIMAKFKNRRGFSLIEMAIVLVIIGIIIGAIIKGQDLIVNSRAKQVISGVNTYRNLAMAFLDRNGRLPGDANKTGQITGDARAELLTSMTNVPTQPINVGSMNFHVFFGSVPSIGGGQTFRNVIGICNTATCNTPFNNDELEIIKAIDTAQDGSADANKGLVRGLVTGDTPVGLTNLITATGFTNYSSGGKASASWSTTHYAAIWAFDRPF